MSGHLAVALATAILIVATPQPALADDPHNVLILYSNEFELPANQAVARGLQGVFDRDPGIRSFTEYLDAVRFPNHVASGDFARHLHAKYDGVKFDLLVALGPQAVAFLKGERPVLAPGAAIVYGGIAAGNPVIADVPDSSGVVSRLDVARAVSLAQVLQPGMKQIVVITGASPADRQWERLTRNQLPGHTGTPAIRFLSGVPLSDALQAVRELPADAMVLYVTMFEDGAGGKYLPREAARRIAAASSVPVYSFFDTYIGTGVVGGFFDRFEAVGHETGALAERILGGEPIASVKPSTSEIHRFVVDGMAMDRFSLDMGLLPPGTIIENWQPPFWQQYFWGIAFTVAAFFAQTLLLVRFRYVVGKRREAERISARHQERMDFTSGAAQLGLWEWDKPTAGFWMSEACRKLLGLGDAETDPFPAISRSAEARTAQALADDFRRLRNSGAPFTRQCEYRLPDGVHWLEFQGARLLTPAGEDRFTGTVKDVTQDHNSQTLLERQRNELAHLSRVSALGLLSGSLAHELNQPLAAILANAQAAQSGLQANSRPAEWVTEAMEDIVTDAKRAGDFIRNLRFLLKRGAVTRVPVALNDVVTSTLKLVRSSTLQRGIHVESHLAPDLPTVAGDAAQFQQVLLNLVINACDAVGAVPQNRRIVTVATRRTAVGGAEVAVKDNGPGFDGDNDEKLFETFFTTKASGLGLGLSICKDIITASGGTISGSNDAGGGAVFTIALPHFEENRT